jgi:hypothetical protein
MKNAHERFGVLEYTKRMKDTTTRIRRCGVEKARGDAGGSIRSSGRGDITIGNGSRTSGEGCTRSRRSTASTDPGSGHTTSDV